MKKRRKLLDLYCKAGGAAVGYYHAGWEIIGVDIAPQKNYPFRFIQADAVKFLEALITYGWQALLDEEPHAIHASPPCQRYSNIAKQFKVNMNYPDLVEPTRKFLIASGKPYVIENVVGAPLINPVMLCGSMFGLKVRRHRLFEANFEIPQLKCDHKKQGKVVQVNGHSGGSSKRDGIKFGSVADWKSAMGIDWMTGAALAEAIPPVYTEYIGKFVP